jgi:gas vesicle protein
MNDQKLDKKVRKDAEKVQKDLSNLAKDGAARLNRFESTVSQATSKAKKDLTKHVESSVSQLSKGFGNTTGNATRALSGTSAKLKKNMGHWLDRFNAKAQEVTVEVPKDLGKKASRSPWIVITICLSVGFLIGLMFLPTRQPVEQVQI